MRHFVRPKVIPDIFTRSVYINETSVKTIVRFTPGVVVDTVVVKTSP